MKQSQETPYYDGLDNVVVQIKIPNSFSRSLNEQCQRDGLTLEELVFRLFLKGYKNDNSDFNFEQYISKRERESKLLCVCFFNEVAQEWQPIREFSHDGTPIGERAERLLSEPFTPEEAEERRQQLAAEYPAYEFKIDEWGTFM